VTNPMKESDQAQDRSVNSFREPLAIIVWAYAIIKVLVFDIDIYLFRLIAPRAQWILNLRVFVLASIIAILWLVLGHRQFIVFFGYIIAYPLVLLFWKLPKLLLRRWAAFLVFLPTIYATVVTFRSTFALYTGAAISTVIIALTEEPILLVLAMLYLSFFLAVALYRAFSRANSSSVFSQLADLLRRLHPKINSGQYDYLPTSATAG